MNTSDKTAPSISVPAKLIDQLQGLVKPADPSLMAGPQVPAPGPSPRPALSMTQAIER
ncbi:MAG: hypothetical protein HYV17_10390 [Xanthomonadales bacterium]|nr:hypothetical protein [Xanthomonadales bacterium]